MTALFRAPIFTVGGSHNLMTSHKLFLPVVIIRGEWSLYIVHQVDQKDVNILETASVSIFRIKQHFQSDPAQFIIQSSSHLILHNRYGQTVAYELHVTLGVTHRKLS
jgi:hypothetical protein